MALACAEKTRSETSKSSENSPKIKIPPSKITTSTWADESTSHDAKQSLHSSSSTIDSKSSEAIDASMLENPDNFPEEHITNEEVGTAINETNNRMAFPWCVADEKVWAAFGIVFLSTMFVPALTVIGLTTVADLFVIRPLLKVSVVYQSSCAVGRGIHAVSSRIAARIMKDPRNHEYLPWIGYIVLVVLPAFCFVLQRHISYGFEPFAWICYNFLRLGQKYRFFAHFQVIVHREGHARGLFKTRNAFTNNFVQIIGGLVYGTMPMSYPISHNKIHHRWHNSVDDVSTNIDLDRSDPWSYVLFVPRFFCYWTGLAPLFLFVLRKEYEFVKPLVAGMVYWFLGLALSCYFGGFIFAAAYVLYPFAETMAFMGAIAYLWHAFVDPNDPECQYVNSVTILNGGDNVWNEDYHVVHHHAPHIHWTKVPEYYKSTEEEYKRTKATVFANTEQGDLLYYLFSQKWDDMARHFVDLSGTMSFEEKRELLLKRLRFRYVSDQDLRGWGQSDARNYGQVEEDEPTKEK